LETSKGDLPMALGLGIVLMTLSLTVNLAASLLKETGERA
jgi:tungstate transport system permease protein